MTNKNKPEFVLTFSKKKLTPEQDNDLIAELVYTLLRWQENEELQKEII